MLTCTAHLEGKLLLLELKASGGG